jgi:hypothetical protein
VPPPHSPSNNFCGPGSPKALMLVLSWKAARPHIRYIPTRRTAASSEQFAFFATSSPEPEGLRYAAEFISSPERELITRVATLPLQPFQFGQYEGTRRVASFGFRYDYTLRRLHDAEPIPEWLTHVIEKVEAFDGSPTQIE